MVAVEVKGWGDFDMPYTDSIWVNYDFNSFDVKSLTDASFDKEPDNLIKELKKLGFTKLNTKSVTFGGGY